VGGGRKTDEIRRRILRSLPSEFAAVGALLGAAITSVLLIGVAERRDKTLWRMGWDSAVMMVLYLGGLALLFIPCAAPPERGCGGFSTKGIRRPRRGRRADR
jgi:hypothetical protein